MFERKPSVLFVLDENRIHCVNKSRLQQNLFRPTPDSPTSTHSKTCARPPAHTHATTTAHVDNHLQD